jgi:uncharacterized protein (DUF1778 family)
MAITKLAESKSARIEVRATEAQRELINRGASARNITVSEYILETMCLQSEMDILDQRVIMVSDKEFAAFEKTLSRPAKANEGLKRLFSKEFQWPPTSK